MGLALAVLIALTGWALRTVGEYRDLVFQLRRHLAALDLELVAMRRRKTCPSCLGLRRAAA